MRDHPDTSTTEDMLSMREVCIFFGGKGTPLDPSTIYRWVRTGKIPPSYRMSRFVQRWKRSELEEALKRMQDKDGQE